MYVDVGKARRTNTLSTEHKKKLSHDITFTLNFQNNSCYESHSM